VKTPSQNRGIPEASWRREAYVLHEPLEREADANRRKVIQAGGVPEQGKRAKRKDRVAGGVARPSGGEEEKRRCRETKKLSKSCLGTDCSDEDSPLQGDLSLEEKKEKRADHAALVKDLSFLGGKTIEEG